MDQDEHEAEELASAEAGQWFGCGLIAALTLTSAILYLIVRLMP